MNQAFNLLFSPIQIGSVTLKNRIACLSHATGFSMDGLPNERHVAYLVEKSRGGAGLIITESQAIHITSIPKRNQLCNLDERVTPWLRKIADAVHENGAKVFAQLSHSGRQVTYRVADYPVVAPSPLFCRSVREESKELEIEEIEEIIDSFGQAAKRSKEAGFDGVEIHSSHGYLIQEFLSPFSNKRTDAYGGSLDNRLRFLLSVIQKIRQETGTDFVVGVRISADEFVEGGLTLDDMAVIVPKIESLATIDYFSVSLGSDATMHMVVPPWYIPLGSFVYLAAGVKNLTKLPVICAVRINDPVQAEKILGDGQADIIGMARALIADPELPNKAREGRMEDIRKCIACNQGCRKWLRQTSSITCTVNAEAGRELEMPPIEPAKNRKKVMIVGGGPAGLECARVAALRGHEVHLFEEDDELGGMISLIAKDPNRNELGESIRYLIQQINKLEVKVTLNNKVTLEMVKQIGPDVVVVATGSKPSVPPIQGMTNGIMTAQEALKGEKEIGESVVIVSGREGHLGPCCLADFLIDKGKKVQLLSELGLIGMDIEHATFTLLVQRLRRKGVILMPWTGVRRIENKTIFAYDVITNEEKTIQNVDTLIWAAMGKANNELYLSLKGIVKELYAVGDCVAPRMVPEAIFEGSKIGRQL